jgi:CRISPR/Cas system-associated exonuclease Cas4 (RecB family)
MGPAGISGEAATDAYRSSRFEAALVLEVLPLDAEVLLDGRPIGSARELVAQAVSVTPGWHTVAVGAPGYYAYIGRFVADQHSSANLFVVTLVPVR